MLHPPSSLIADLPDDLWKDVVTRVWVQQCRLVMPHLQGLCALTSAADPNLLAVPVAPDSGVIRVFDLLKEGGNLLCELKAHKTSLVNPATFATDHMP